MKPALILLVLFITTPFYSQTKGVIKPVKDKKANATYYDFNKNGRLDIYTKTLL